MRTHYRALLCLLSALLGLSVMAVVTSPAGAAEPAAATAAAEPQLVSETPDFTPNVEDGKVLAIAEVGNRVLVAGTFTSVSDPKGGATYPLKYLFAYDANTGLVDPSFAPEFTSEVIALEPAADGTSVYASGGFSRALGKPRNIVQLDATTGARTASFNPPKFPGDIKDLQLVGGRLLLGGSFTTAVDTITKETVARGGFASIDATTGALDDYLDVDVAENHNYGVVGTTNVAKGAVGVSKFEATPDGTRLFAIGNFRKADGMDRDQMVKIRLGADDATVDPDWRTERYRPACVYTVVDSYVRDIAISPDGSYAVVVSTGAGYANTLCDAAARFSTSESGQQIQPEWVQATGCDTLLSVEITAASVFVGGHQKWVNAPNTGCSGTAQQGQVARPGLAALEPKSGVPQNWNPGRIPRGHGTEELLMTGRGLYVGSDTDYIGNFRHRRAKVAFFPAVDGAPVTQPAMTLAAPLYQRVGSAWQVRRFDGTTATAPSPIPAGPTDSVGGFMIGNKYVYARTVGKQLAYRTFDGETWGPETAINSYVDSPWSSVLIESTTRTFIGKIPDFYSQLGSLTSMTYLNGRIYYTLSGQNVLYWRWFSPDSLVIGPNQFTVPGAPSDLRTARGMFAAGDSLYIGVSSGPNLFRLNFAGGVPASSWVHLTGTGASGTFLSSTHLFLGPVANLAPTAAFTQTCTELTCAFDASTSADADGTVASYAWDFGGGETATGAKPEHTFTSAGTHRVKLTVTDDDGKSHTTEHDVALTQSPVGKIESDCAALACDFDASGSTDDGSISSFAWDFGDGTQGTGATAQHTYAAAGTYQVTLRLTDDAGTTSTTTRAVAVSEQPIAFRDSTSASANLKTATITVPSSVQPGDALVFTLSTAAATAGQPTGVAGFTPVGEPVTAGTLVTRVWQKVAQPGDAGAKITVPLSEATAMKYSAAVLAYTGTDATTPVGPTATASDNVATTTHSAPSVDAVDGGLVVRIWSDKGSTTASFIAPASMTTRATQLGVGGGKVDLVAADSGQPVAAGPTGSADAVTDVATRGTGVTLVLKPLAR